MGMLVMRQQPDQALLKNQGKMTGGLALLWRRVILIEWYPGCNLVYNVWQTNILPKTCSRHITE